MNINSIFKSALISSFLLTQVALSQDLPSHAPKKIPTPKKIQAKSQPRYYGSSGINPYDYSEHEKDEAFIADRGGDLDNYLFNDSSPYEFDINITRYFGKTYPDGQIEFPDEIELPEKVKLTITVYDVDDDYADTDVRPEKDLISINGHKLSPETLTSGNNTWNTIEYQVPIAFLKFPSEPGKIGKQN